MVDFYNQESFLEFEQLLLATLEKPVSILILSIPGLGYTHFSEKFAEKHKDKGVKHIRLPGESLSNFNILDLDFDIQEDALEISDEYFRQATKKQKFAVIINDPSLIKKEEYMESKTASRLYNTFVFKARNYEDTKNFASEVNSELVEDQLQILYKISGGIGRIIKYLSINPDKLQIPIDDLIADKRLYSVLESTISVIARCDDEILEEIGVWEKGEYKSAYLAQYYKKYPSVKKLSIATHSDLSFKENGEVSKERLTQTEKQILDLLVRETIITREKVADIKWGEGSYDEYSDQAINKTMQRLGNKLKEYQLIPIPKVGYKLTTK